MSKVHNYSAGPCILPNEVFKEAADSILNFNNLDLSLIEISHRSKDFVAVMEEARTLVREILEVPDDYEVLFLQGGASHQFAMVPMNLAGDKFVEVVNTGSWTKKAIGELKKGYTHRIVATGESENFLTLPTIAPNLFSNDAAYAYMCSNNTIFI